MVKIKTSSTMEIKKYITQHMDQVTKSKRGHTLLKDVYPRWKSQHNIRYDMIQHRRGSLGD